MRIALVLVLLAVSCNVPTTSERVSTDPISVRGWIADVEGGAPEGTLRTIETELARKTQLFKSTTVWVEGATYVSGSIGENGSFILLDVPPGNVTITFTAPGAESSQLVLKDIPGNADVLVPALELRKTSAVPLDPRLVRVRMAARVDKPAPTGQDAFVAGHRVPVVNTPYAAMVDRRDFPNPPGSEPPLAILK
jgi:hypothetical protein